MHIHYPVANLSLQDTTQCLDDA